MQSLGDPEFSFPLKKWTGKESGEHDSAIPQFGEFCPPGTLPALSSELLAAAESPFNKSLAGFKSPTI